MPRSRGVSKQRAVPAHRGGDLELDRSMDAILAARAEARAPGIDEMTAIQWARPDLAFCLVIDHSGSMNGARLTTAAVTGAACLTLAPQEHAVLAFAASPRCCARSPVRRARPRPSSGSSPCAATGRPAWPGPCGPRRSSWPARGPGAG